MDRIALSIDPKTPPGPRYAPAVAWGASLLVAVAVSAIAVNLLDDWRRAAALSVIIEEILKCAIALLLSRTGLLPIASGVGFGFFEITYRLAGGFYVPSMLVGVPLAYWIIVPLGFHTITGWAYANSRAGIWMVATTFLLIGAHFLVNSFAGVPKTEGISYIAWGAILLSVASGYAFLTVAAPNWRRFAAALWLIPAGLVSALGVLIMATG